MDADEYEDFKEIENCGGWVTIAAGGASSKIQSVRPGRAVRITMFCMAFSGEVLGWVPMGGLGAPIPCPQPTIGAFLASDREGYFGRTCPMCKRYFRVDAIGADGSCAYCLCHTASKNFLTENQLDYFEKYQSAYMDAIEKNEQVVLHLDAVSGALAENHHPASYSERTQQARHKCPDCDVTVDFAGLFAHCPRCGRRNLREVVSAKTAYHQERLREGNSKTDRDQRAEAWRDVVEGVVSDFEVVVKDVRHILAQMPLVPHRRKMLDDMHCQSITSVAGGLKEAVGIDVLDGPTEDDERFLRMMFQRRHAFIHKGGVVDQEYLDRSGDPRFPVGALIRIRSSEATRFARLVDETLVRLLDGYESISEEPRP